MIFVPFVSQTLSSAATPLVVRGPGSTWVTIFGPAGSSLRNSGTGLGATAACVAYEWRDREGGEQFLIVDRRRALGFEQPPRRAGRRMKDIL